MNGEAGILVKWRLWVMGAAGMCLAGQWLDLPSPPEIVSFKLRCWCSHTFSRITWIYGTVWTQTWWLCSLSLFSAARTSRCLRSQGKVLILTPKKSYYELVLLAVVTIVSEILLPCLLLPYYLFCYISQMRQPFYIYPSPTDSFCSAYLTLHIYPCINTF